MVPLESVLAFVVASTLLIVIPGPSVLFVIGRSIALGRRAGLISVLGNAPGTLPAVLAVSFGVGAIIAASVMTFTIIKIAGALYLAYLGIQAIRHRARKVSTGAETPTSSARLLWQGIIVGATNRKTIAFFVAVLPQFVSPETGPVWLQLMTLGLVFNAIALCCDAVWALVAGTARAWFAASPKRMQGMSVTGGVMMIGLGGAMAFASPQH